MLHWPGKARAIHCAIPMESQGGVERPVHIYVLAQVTIGWHKYDFLVTFMRSTFMTPPMQGTCANLNCFLCCTLNLLVGSLWYKSGRDGDSSGCNTRNFDSYTIYFCSSKTQNVLLADSFNYSDFAINGISRHD